MAELRIHGKWGGPGEEETARFLEKNLPTDWTIDANVYLPTKNHEDVDLLVTGRNFVFIVEVKSVGPIVLVDDHIWEVRWKHGKKYEFKSPMPNLAHKARQAVQILQKAVPEGAKILRQRPVDRVLILCHPTLSLHGNVQDSDRLVALQDSARRLEELDSREETDLSLHRSEIVKAISGLAPRAEELTELGDYLISEKLERVGLASRFRAEHKYAGESVVLYCYKEPDTEHEARHQERETEVIKKLEGLQRTWKTYPPFVDHNWGWFVRPQVRPDGARSLSELSVTEALRNFGSDPLRGLVRESFEALAQVHAAEVVHRVLSPTRVWLGLSQRVFFSDFFLARLDDKQTLIPIPADKGARPFAAPENVEDSHAATEASDVFALASILLQWIRSGIAADGLDPLETDSELLRLLEACMNEKHTSRPTASELASSLKLKTVVLTPPEDSGLDGEDHELEPLADVEQFEVGKLVGRFKLEEPL